VQTVENQTILIVSADGYQTKFMVDCLEDAGYETCAADLAESALELIADGNPNLVILDWGFLHSHGLQIILMIREQSNHAHPPILVMGMGMREEEVLAALEAGADICLTERLHPKVFVARVHSLLRRTNHHRIPSS
jgi:DNA-binding response OmpR family regulator